MSKRDRIVSFDRVDQERLNEIETNWAAELEERIDAVDRGDLQTLDGPTALGDLSSSLRKTSE